MSDLQISLLAAGVLVVLGVYLFNLWQERSFRRKTEQAFAREHEDVLMGTPAPEALPRTERAEPRIAPPAPPAAERAEALSRLDPAIDYTVEVEAPAATEAADLHEELVALAATWSKPVLVAGYDAAADRWVEAGLDGAGKFSRLRAGVQVTNRAGCITRSQLAAFRDAVAQWAERSGAASSAPDVAEAHKMAQEVDRFCSEVDVAFGINVVGRTDAPFTGVRIRDLAEQSGFKLEPDGVFHYRGDGAGPTLFTLDNHEPMPFVPEQMNAITTRGVTFLLDVPRVADPAAALEKMLETARGFAAGIDGALVDDNRAPLKDAGIDKIRSQLRTITSKMQAGQVEAGSSRALRLFS
jgi:hypothetical protein